MIKVQENLHYIFSRFALALSGGSDSLAAAAFLKRGKKDFIAIHVNAKYIPQDDECEKRVRAFCEELSIPLIVKTCNKKYTKGSVEAFCRINRYDLMEEVCIENDIKHLIVCHHLDDCVESYLMNSFNGVGEYCPIPYKTVYKYMTVWRPFLQTTKKDFSNYLKRQNLSHYVTEDELNSNLSLRRNWIRHELRPMIETKYPGLKKVVAKIVEKHYNKIM